MLGRGNPLKELDGDEYKLAREDGFGRGRRTGWLVSALLGIPGATIGVIAGVGASGVGAVAGVILFPLAAIAGALVLGAIAQMYSDRRNSIRAADMLLNQRELIRQKEGRGEPSQDMAPEGQEQGKGQKQEKGNAGQHPQQGKAMPPKSGQMPATVPQGLPQGYPPAPHMMPQGMPYRAGHMMPPQPAPQFHNVATVPQMPAGSVVGNHTAQLATRNRAPVPVRS